MVKRIKIEQEKNEVEEKIIEMLLEKAKAGETTYADLNKILNGLRGKMIQKLLNLEFEEHMKYKKGSHEEKKTSNRRNGISSKKEVRTNDGIYEIEMPRDREGSFEPILVPKRKRIIGELSEQITLLYAKGNSIRDIKEILEGLYGTKLNEEFISEATKMVSEEVMEWKKRPLKEIYSIIYMDCLYTTVRKENKSEKVAIYVALGIDITGKKEVIGFWEGESESSSFWYGVLEEIKERQVFIESIGEPIVKENKFNSIFGLSRKNYQKKVKEYEEKKKLIGKIKEAIQEGQELDEQINHKKQEQK